MSPNWAQDYFICFIFIGVGATLLGISFDSNAKGQINQQDFQTAGIVLLSLGGVFLILTLMYHVGDIRDQKRTALEIERGNRTLAANRLERNLAQERRELAAALPQGQIVGYSKENRNWYDPDQVVEKAEAIPLSSIPIAEYNEIVTALSTGYAEAPPPRRPKPALPPRPQLTEAQEDRIRMSRTEALLNRGIWNNHAWELFAGTRPDQPLPPIFARARVNVPGREAYPTPSS